MKRIIIAASLAALAACDIGTTVDNQLPADLRGAVSNCTSEKFGTNISFRIQDIQIWRGTGGVAVEVTSEQTGQRVRLREDEAWMCTTNGVTKPLIARRSAQPSND